MTAIAKSAKRHPAAKKCCGWKEPAMCDADLKCENDPASNILFAGNKINTPWEIGLKKNYFDTIFH